MACGIPVISSNRSFNRDILNEDNSILIDPEDIRGIADAINDLYVNKDKRIALGENALETSHVLSIENRAKAIIDFVEQNISKN